MKLSTGFPIYINLENEVFVSETYFNDSGYIVRRKVLSDRSASDYFGNRR